MGNAQTVAYYKTDYSYNYIVIATGNGVSMHTECKDCDKRTMKWRECSFLKPCDKSYDECQFKIQYPLWNYTSSQRYASEMERLTKLYSSSVTDESLI